MENKSEPKKVFPGSDLIKAAPGKQCIIVKKQGCAEALKGIFRDKVLILIFDTDIYPHVSQYDFTVFEGRKVVIWFPNYQYDSINAQDIAKELIGIAEPRILIPPSGTPVSWCATEAVREGYDFQKITEYFKLNLKNPQDKKDHLAIMTWTYDASVAEDKLIEESPDLAPPPDQPPPPDLAAVNYSSDDFDISGEQYHKSIYPFKFLGYDKNKFYYLPDGAQQIVCLTGPEHEEKNISSFLAPIDFWERHWAATKRFKDASGEWRESKSGVDWRAVRRFLIWTMQYKAGVYHGENIRGPGVWMDGTRVIIHLGDRLLMDGIPVLMSRIKSRYIYEKRRPLDPDDGFIFPLDVREANEIIKVLESFSWTGPINARLLAGWIVASLIGGALPWRPHVWINGPQSCGKSTILNLVVRRLCGECTAIVIEGATTEAGLRQQANHCSFPILFDEAESNDQKGKIRMEQIIELMRSSASPNGGKLVKGTPGGGALMFDIQSCFCLASISNNSNLAADVARIVNLELKVPDAKVDKWELKKQRILDTFNSHYCQKFRHRIFKMVPTIQKNIEVFIRAVRDELDSQRFGDVYGVLLGSAYCLFSDNIISEEAARDWVKKQDWTEEKRLRDDSDEIKLLKRILQRIITIKGDTRPEDRTLWEIIKAVKEFTEKPFDYLPEAEASLTAEADYKNKIEIYHESARRFGVWFRQEDGRNWVTIANDNTYIESWLENTQFVPNWSKWLKRVREVIDGKEYEARPLSARQFEKGKASVRSIMVPFEICERHLEADNEIKKQPINERF
jgi:putative DNA primase/helicase